MSAFTGRAPFAAALCLAVLNVAQAKAEVDSISVDLAPAIRATANQRARFAVEVPHGASAARDGEWVESAGTSRWHYRARIPTALSISFHASGIKLPPSASVSVHSPNDAGVQPSVKPGRGGELWSPIIKGDSLDIEIALDTRDRATLAFDIVSFQAGYRSLDPSVPDHPAYRRLHTQSLTAQATAASCTQNYACSITPDNTGPGAATVGIVVRNALYCTATLINDVQGTNTPYLLTARHCQTGDGAHGDSTAASSVVVHWNAVTPCGDMLGFFPSVRTAVQEGATTVVEQQDAWLLKLDDNPAVDNAYFAGFDATGGDVVDGYTIHHATALAKQYVEWAGHAASTSDDGSTLHVPYSTQHWATVNRLGTAGPGSSGSALFDRNNRVVGSLSLGRVSQTEGDECPAPSPPRPSKDTALAFFTQLGQLWTNTSDPSSSTGNTTFKSVLDPLNTGTRVVNGAAAKAFVRMDVTPYGTVGGFLFVSWDANGATSCVMTGGRPGDGWSGPLPIATRPPQLSESEPGKVTYGITCTFGDGHTSSAQKTVDWSLPAPSASFYYIFSDSLWITRPFHLQWFSNVPPCSFKGGSYDLTNIDLPGAIDLTETQPGTYLYTLSCGSGTRAAQSSVQVTFTAPALEFRAEGSDRRVGSSITLNWFTHAETCVPGGGQPGDTWASNLYGGQPALQNYSTLAKTPGVYTYRLTCTAGQLSVARDATVTVSNDPLYAQLTASDNPIASGEQVTVFWKSNADYCFDYPSNSVTTGHLFTSSVDGSADFRLNEARTFTYRCFGGSNLPTIDKTLEVKVVPQPSMILEIQKNTLKVGDSFTVHWNTQNTVDNCTASGGGADGTQWTGSVAVPQGDKVITANVAGKFTYALDCVGLLPRLKQHVEQVVEVAAASAPPSGNGGGGSSSGNSGGGGGGAIDRLTCLLLALSLSMVIVSRSRRLAR